MASFCSNLKEDVFQVVQEIFALDYARQLKFQTISEEEESADQTTDAIWFTAGPLEIFCGEKYLKIGEKASYIVKIL